MILDKVNSPEDLKRLSLEELLLLAEEIRSEIIRVTAQNGGHLASSLGAVELVLALHRVFDSPRDRILFDVGHQAYAHKLVTGRKDRFHTLRKEGGISGFTKVSESPHDAITAGHASTSLANALGMVLARDLMGEDYHVVAVIGDGALTGGMALAALNKIGELQKRMLIVLNDNEMSISENVGALNKYFKELQIRKWVQDAEKLGKNILERISPQLFGLVDRAKEAAKFLLHQENPFYAWGIRYVGPVDGHDLKGLVHILEHLKALDGPTLLHVVTKKGKGYKVAEADPIYWHGPPGFDPKKPEKVSKGYTWSQAFGDAVTELAHMEPRLFVLTPAMREGSGLVRYSLEHPERYLDVGICEDVAVTTAAGLALRGMKPIVAIYSTFLQRAYDQVIHDVAIENLPVVFAIDRAGIVGADGATHHGVFDIAYLRTVPNLQIAAPKDALELRAMLKKALEVGGPVAIRYPRDNVERAPEGVWPEIAWGKWEVLKEGTEAYILAFGKTLRYALEAAGDDPRVGVVNARFLKPLDREMLRELSRYKLLTVEDHQKMGGFGSAVLEALNEMGLKPEVQILGLPDRFFEHGAIPSLHRQAGIDAEGIRKALAAMGVALVHERA
ncbi:MULTISPECIES: 1-deoxy-D-xylulose-5-phosphate synthase [Thermus]|jgi:1-deoxy-D-xylulose-5-phosphate synthase|uniref:1-deoxy-D-xylulose-5-phosphate synthase n=3 Tax=Thermus thermophilus TaxID=274 RepID=DXS_THET8|nr:MULTISPECIES: 1-deoxy-D-xylulose-5-phosphate synthase [Thermus]Q5SMD7.1 RecName: Full=1-deoxy-D-xylulose-5-phosphate synthase; AltName: Full=1-deoxyxylulose-5-phosphate synthase; Short=DXP synthase; Short=DXPS [Thermus thermophilus HB8]QZY58540.1 1-deoxy-D-xylulose-5-phosphate synthase [Thermus thermophilus]BAD69829.1 1-deoxy-D-xylulose-5-phosphate synthase [Thermus thermophilus HB8]BDA36642.1 1-deoxy-D-xylulose-5-phosphate synthase [Thermus thermophilus]BDE44364.1 1-deoxy-D-xylulose-5-phos